MNESTAARLRSANAASAMESNQPFAAVNVYTSIHPSATLPEYRCGQEAARLME